MKIKTLFLTAGIGLLTVAGFIGFPWLALYLGIMLSPNPPSPTVTYGEFPFRLEYEINGEHKVVEDTLMCKFDGFGWNESEGKYRKWKINLASGNEKAILLQINETDYIHCNPGYANYYMGDAKFFVSIIDAYVLSKMFKICSKKSRKDRGCGVMAGNVRMKQMAWQCKIRHYVK